MKYSAAITPPASPKNDIETDKQAPQLQPGERERHTRPPTTPAAESTFASAGGVGGETADAGNKRSAKRRACERHKQQNKKTPARPNERKRLGDNQIQTAPTNQHQHKGRKPKRFE
jgi:hypothetical protein